MYGCTQVIRSQGYQHSTCKATYVHTYNIYINWGVQLYKVFAPKLTQKACEWLSHFILETLERRWYLTCSEPLPSPPSLWCLSPLPLYTFSFIFVISLSWSPVSFRAAAATRKYSSFKKSTQLKKPGLDWRWNPGNPRRAEALPQVRLSWTYCQVKLYF